MKNRIPRYYIDTWADSHGRWHALVEDRTINTYDRLDPATVNRIRAAGRRAILREIRARDIHADPRAIRTYVEWRDTRQMGATDFLGAPNTLHIRER